jgi:hypothetical protein
MHTVRAVRSALNLTLGVPAGVAEMPPSRQGHLCVNCYEKAGMPVIARPRISACTSWVPS